MSILPSMPISITLSAYSASSSHLGFSCFSINSPASAVVMSVFVVVYATHIRILYRSAQRTHCEIARLHLRFNKQTSEDAIACNVESMHWNKTKKKCIDNACSCHPSMTSEHGLIAIYFDKLIIFDTCILRLFVHSERILINRHGFYSLFFLTFCRHRLFSICLFFQ